MNFVAMGVGYFVMVVAGVLFIVTGLPKNNGIQGLHNITFHRFGVWIANLEYPKARGVACNAHRIGYHVRELNSTTVLIFTRPTPIRRFRRWTY